MKILENIAYKNTQIPRYLQSFLEDPVFLGKNDVHIFCPCSINLIANSGGEGGGVKVVSLWLGWTGGLIKDDYCTRMN